MAKDVKELSTSGKRLASGGMELFPALYVCPQPAEFESLIAQTYQQQMCDNWAERQGREITQHADNEHQTDARSGKG